MADLKTRPGRASVSRFIDGIENEQRRRDCRTLMRMMKQVTGKRAVLWGGSIAGYGRYHYRYRSGREGDWFVTGFSPRKQYLTIYIMPGFEKYPDLMGRLGRYKTGRSCLYLRRLDDVDQEALAGLVARSVADMAGLYECR